MSPAGRRAAPDGSFGRSTSAAALRGVVLIGIAVLVGIVLLRSGSDDGLVAAGPKPSGNVESTSTTTPGSQPGSTSSTTAVLRPPAELTVLVANASGVSGAAGRLGARLGQSPPGYDLLEGTNANQTSQTSTVYHQPGLEREAAALAAEIGATAVAEIPTPAPVDDLRGADLLVVLGRDLAT